jgi:alpha-tubulin suppressor-like RCC1 family protein
MTSIPTKIESLSNIIQISSGYEHSLVLDKTGRVFYFGKAVSIILK